MAFMDKYIDEFDANNENKLIYTTIFNEYTAMTESYIEKVQYTFLMTSFLFRI